MNLISYYWLWLTCIWEYNCSHHWKNAIYLMRHKWYVFRHGLKLRVPIHQLILHDWTKLLPIEWFADARHHHAKNHARPGDFLRGRLHHIHWNKHHWQHWVVMSEQVGPDGRTYRCAKMPERFIREMVADWIAAGLAKDETWNARQWFEAHEPLIRLHGDSKNLLVELLHELYPKD